MQDTNNTTNEVAVAPTLRDMALQALSARGGITSPIVQYLRAFEEAYSNDFVYLLMLRQELTIRMLRQLTVNMQKQYTEAAEHYTLDQTEWLEDANRNIRRQEQFFRSQFRRLRRIHRERLFERIVLFGMGGAFAMFLALCVFYFCRLFE